MKTEKRNLFDYDGPERFPEYGSLKKINSSQLLEWAKWRFEDEFEKELQRWQEKLSEALEFKNRTVPKHAVLVHLLDDRRKKDLRRIKRRQSNEELKAFMSKVQVINLDEPKLPKLVEEQTKLTDLENFNKTPLNEIENLPLHTLQAWAVYRFGAKLKEPITEQRRVARIMNEGKSDEEIERIAYANLISRQGVRDIADNLRRKSFTSSMEDTVRYENNSRRQAKPLHRGKAPEFVQDLTDLARRGVLHPVAGREDETKRLLQILCRKGKGNPVLVGEAGVGKTAIVESLAVLLLQPEYSKLVGDRPLWSVSTTSIVAGCQYVGMLEQRIEELLKAAEASKAILFVDEIHVILGAGKGREGASVGELLKPYLARNGIRVIGATTLREYQFLMRDGALERRFAPVLVNEPSPEKTTEILKHIRHRFEKHYDVLVSDEMCGLIVEVAQNISDRHFPDKAIELLDETLSGVRIRSVEPGGAKELQAEDIYRAFADIQQTREALSAFAS